MTSTTHLSGARTDGNPVPVDHRAVLVPLDGSELSEHALAPASWLADQLGAELDIVAVVDPLAPLPTHGERHHGALVDPTDYVTGLTRIPELTGITVEANVAVDPLGPDEGLVDHLRDHPAALVATTSRLRIHFDRALHGSTASRIVHASPVPVLVQPAVRLDAERAEGRP